MHEKKAFYKFFFTYFLSVALLILAGGHFYYKQMYNQLFRAEHFSVLEYAKALKSGKLYEDKVFHFDIEDVKIAHFSMDNIELTPRYFIKRVPYKWDYGYYVIYKDRSGFDAKVDALVLHVILLQLLLLALFGVISFVLAKNALSPMRKAIDMLDRFSKDLIHDLNTPVTAIKLNIKLLEKDKTLVDNRVIGRIKKSANEIAELHDNLLLLLEEGTFILEDVALCQLVEEVVADYKPQYSHLRWIIECQNLHVKSNAKALKQILSNLISNACKYNRDGGTVHLFSDKNSLSISDSGVGIKEPKKVFDRNYKEHQSGHGIGLDIVKRLCESMGITIEVSSSKEGSCFRLAFD